MLLLIPGCVNFIDRNSFRVLIYWCTDSWWEAVFPWAGTIQVWIIGLLWSHARGRWQKGSVTYIPVFWKKTVYLF